MNDFSAIDGFLNTFTTYIDSGFGLISGDVTSLAAILIAIDVTIAGVNTPPVEQPRKTSAPFTTSASVRAEVRWQ